MRNLITKRPWLVATSAMAVALMAVTFLAATSFAGQVQAGTTDANNAGMMAGDTTVFTNATDTDGWVNIAGLSGVMHKASQKDMVLDVSLECSLYTDTEVKSKGGNKDTSTAIAGVQVQVVVTDEDGVSRVMEPGPVTFCRRSQTLSAVFQGLLTDDDGNVCLTAELDEFGNATGAIIIDEDCLRPEELQLILETTNANAFNFVQFDLAQGNYHVQVQAQISSSAEAGNGSADAWATIGKGSAILEEVRFAKTRS